MKLYAEISKTEELDDGTVKVWGYASSGAVDADGETITPDAMKAALPDYMKFGAVREMHRAKAAGTAIEASVEEDGRTFFGAHVVDSEAVKKIKANVYKGFSIGGKITERDSMNKSVIKGIKLVEVSLVDRPANPDALFTMYEAEDIEPSAVDQLADLLDKGKITPERLIELAKADKAAEVEPEQAEEVEKGMWCVQDFAAALNSLGSICSSAEWEAQSEGDNSPVPAQLRAWLAQGVEIFKTMAAEELEEMMASLKEQAGELPEVDVMQMGDKTGDLGKKGAAFSASTKDKLKKAHDAIKTASDHMDSLGYANDDDGDEGKKADEADDLAKAELADKLSKVEAERDDLKKRVEELEAQPEPAKGALKVVEKGADITDDAQPDETEITKGMTPEELALHEIRKVYATGGRPLSQR